MRWNEIITVYLAIGAPFAAARWLRAHGNETIRQRVTGMLMVAMGWPLAGARWAARGWGGVIGGGFDADAIPPDQSFRVEQLQRRLLAALYLLRDTAFPGERPGELDLISARLRESLDQYASLSLLSRGQVPNAGPAAHETEFFRVAGRSSGDLQVAAKCLNRRNTARLARHLLQAQRDLLQDLQAAQSWAGDRLTLLPAAHPVRQALPTMFVAARDLCRLFDDAAAAAKIEDLMRGEVVAARDPRLIICNTPTPREQTTVQL